MVYGIQGTKKNKVEFDVLRSPESCSNEAEQESQYMENASYYLSIFTSPENTKQVIVTGIPIV